MRLSSHPLAEHCSRCSPYFTCKPELCMFTLKYCNNIGLSSSSSSYILICGIARRKATQTQHQNWLISAIYFISLLRCDAMWLDSIWRFPSIIAAPLLFSIRTVKVGGGGGIVVGGGLISILGSRAYVVGTGSILYLVGSGRWFLFTELIAGDRCTSKTIRWLRAGTIRWLIFNDVMILLCTVTTRAAAEERISGTVLIWIEKITIIIFFWRPTAAAAAAAADVGRRRIDEIGDIKAYYCTYVRILLRRAIIVCGTISHVSRERWRDCCGQLT